MTPSEQCREAGLDSLAELARITHVSERTLINWHRHKPRQFQIMILGAVVFKEQNKAKTAQP